MPQAEPDIELATGDWPGGFFFDDRDPHAADDVADEVEDQRGYGGSDS